MNTHDDRPFPPAHKIRLSSQWELQPLPDNSQRADGTLSDDAMPAAQRLKHVSDHTQSEAAERNGRFRLVRRFGRPHGLSPSDRIELVCEGLRPAAIITLNARVLQPLSRAGAIESPDTRVSVRFDVFAILRDRNQLAIEFDSSETPGPAEVVGEVRLEIFAGGEIGR